VLTQKPQGPGKSNPIAVAICLYSASMKYSHTFPVESVTSAVRFFNAIEDFMPK
jgi:hypothetical protein